MANIFEETCKLSQTTRNIMLEDAFKSKNKHLINIAMAAGAELNYGVLRDAIRLGYEDVVKTILESNKVLSVKAEKADILTFAIKEPESISRSCLRLLIEHGALVTRETFIEFRKRLANGITTSPEAILDVLVEYAKKEDVRWALLEFLKKY